MQFQVCLCLNCKDIIIYVLKFSTHQPMINIEKKIICSPIKCKTVVKKKLSIEI